MSEPASESSKQDDQDAFMRLASAIGDLGSPFYEEERQRDVWNEASAVGFQAMLWLGMIGANVMIWVGRTAAIPYVFGLVLIVGLGSLLTVGYATRLGVDAEEAGQRWRPAMGVFMALFASVAVGMLLSVDWNAGGLGAAAARGIAAGSAVGVVAGSGWIVWRHRRTTGPT